jgi:hypothetical protein
MLKTKNVREASRLETENRGCGPLLLKELKLEGIHKMLREKRSPGLIPRHLNNLWHTPGR